MQVSCHIELDLNLLLFNFFFGKSAVDMAQAGCVRQGGAPMRCVEEK
jgi:hypothetical protein